MEKGARGVDAWEYHGEMRGTKENAETEGTGETRRLRPVWAYGKE